MTPTPEGLVACLRGEAKDWGNGMATVGSGLLTDAADLITAQAEQLRQMREALEAISLVYMGPPDEYNERREIDYSWAPKVRAALALPISEAEATARSNAEKAANWDDETTQAHLFWMLMKGSTDQALEYYRKVKAAREASDGK